MRIAVMLNEQANIWMFCSAACRFWGFSFEKNCEREAVGSRWCLASIELHSVSRSFWAGALKIHAKMIQRMVIVQRIASTSSIVMMSHCQCFEFMNNSLRSWSSSKIKFTLDQRLSNADYVCHNVRHNTPHQPIAIKNKSHPASNSNFCFRQTKSADRMHAFE